jgi:acyl-CoA synthetase (AMP-forming)/AMP-acid ligase II
MFKSPHQDLIIPETPLTPFVLRNAQRLGGKPAFIDGATGRSISYAEAAATIPKLAATLAERGFTKGDVLAVYAPNLPEYPLVIHATSTAGGAITTANPLSSAEDLHQQLCATKARFLVTTSSLLSKASIAANGSSVSEIFTIDECASATSLKQLSSSNASPVQIDFNPKHDVVALPFSSGTTGLPKGVMLTHFNMVANAAQYASLGITTEQDIVLSVPPLFHIYGITVVANTIMANGATVVTMPQFDFEQFLKLSQEYRVTQAFLVPSVVQLLAKHPLTEKFDLSSLKTIISGGAPLAEELSASCSKRLGCVILQAYGMTEAGPVTHFSYTDAARNRPGAIGHAYPNTNCRIIDITTGDDLGADQEGEIWINGPQVMKGYLNAPAETDKILDKDGWLRTGDVGKIDSDGYLTVLDRIKELIKVKGFQVAPAELEALLLGHQAVADVAVIPSPDEESGEVPVALVVKRDEVTADELMEFIAERVTYYKRIRAVEFLAEIPKTSSGKILRRDLVERQRAKVRQPATSTSHPA